MNNSTRISVILNPAAGRGQGKTRRAELGAHLRKTALRKAAGDWQIIETQAAGDATRLARQATQNSDVVAAAGGDGTLSEVVNGMMAAQELGHNAVLALLPLGTGNDFSRCLGIGTDLQFAVDTLLNGVPRAVDLGQVSFTDNGAPRWFINIAGCGFDALVAQRVNDFRQRRGWRHVRGMPAYLCAVLQELVALRPASVEFRLDGEAHAQQAVLCAVANASSYGGGMLVAPDAQIDDGQFDLCVIGGAGRMEFLRAFPSVFSGAHVSHPRVSIRRASEVHISSEPPLPVLVDGEVLGTTPATFRIVPRALEIMAPR